MSALEPLLADFAPIGLDALNAKAAMLERLDRKYVLDTGVLGDALAALRAQFDVLQIDGRRAFAYDTCYFDDADRRSFHDHQQGRRRRMKVRVRRYVEAAACFVEVKLKGPRGVTVKRRMPYPLDRYGTLDAAAMAHVRRCHQALYGLPFERELEPVLQMHYRRSTLVARVGGERITIDAGIRFHGDGRGGFGPRDDVVIVETKSAHGHGLADAVLRGLHQHPTEGCSKYCIGLSAAGAAPRFNRFRPALRRLGLWPHGVPQPA